MKCPFCGTIDSQVLESRICDEGDSIRRRRTCHHCGKRFTTYERLHRSTLWVVKKDGKREPWDRDKVRGGILRAIRKRPVALPLVDSIVNGIEQEVLRKEKQEVQSKVVGRLILKRLKKIDKVAWLRFASVYLEFEDLEDFEKAIDSR
jgi:transcriptional repressor NrdR